MHQRGRNKRRSFVLLEVTLSIIILSIAMTALLRGFLLSMNSIQQVEIIAVANQLTDSLMEDYELEPPLKGRVQGDFSDDVRFGDAFENFRWERDVTEIEPDYRDKPRNLPRELEPLYRLELELWYEYPNGEEFLPLRIDTYLMNSEIFSYNARASNQMF